MRSFLDIRKLFWLINSVLLTILLYILLSFVHAQDAVKSTLAQSIPIIETVEIIHDKNPLLPDKHKMIVERNIFKYSGSSLAKENLQLKKNTDAPTSVISANFRLLATIAGDDQVACAVIGDMRSRVQDIYQVGDIINGAQIERIERNKVVFLCGEQRQMLNLCISREGVPIEHKKETVTAQVQQAVKSAKFNSPSKRDVNQKVYVTNVSGMEAFLENMKVAPYIVNGKGEGLCITGLKDLKMAGYFGLEDGDVIQTINGQMLTDKQKAFQVLKKARSQTSLNFQLLRNKQKMDMSFEMK